MRRQPKFPTWAAVIVVFLALLVLITLRLSSGILSPHLPIAQAAFWGLIAAVLLTLFAFVKRPR